MIRRFVKVNEVTILRAVVIFGAAYVGILRSNNRNMKKFINAMALNYSYDKFSQTGKLD
jgi:hypothetical protein